MNFKFNNHRSGKGKDQGGADLFDTAISMRDEVKAFVEKWNSHVWLPKIIGTDRQARMIRDAMRRPFFARNWMASFDVMARSKFLVFKMKPSIRIDWYLEPDNFDKIMEGVYLDEDKKPKLERIHKTGINEEGDEIIT